MAINVKICGITTPGALMAASSAGASHMGLNFYPPSPRAVTLDAAADLAGQAPDGLTRVGVFVDPDDSLLNAVLGAVPLDWVQLLGAESGTRVAEIGAAFAKPVVKAISIADRGDIELAHSYENVADFLLFDAKPPKSMAHSLPGGTGLAFDWTLIAGETWSVPWILAGGLTRDNVGEAISRTGARFVDVSSGVEDEPGVKSPAKIKAFVEAAQGQEI